MDYEVTDADMEDFYSERAAYEAETEEEYPPCDVCGQPCGNAQGRHYECACISGEDLDRTNGFGELAHIW